MILTRHGGLNYVLMRTLPEYGKEMTGNVYRMSYLYPATSYFMTVVLY